MIGWFASLLIKLVFVLRKDLVGQDVLSHLQQLLVGCPESGIELERFHIKVLRLSKFLLSFVDQPQQVQTCATIRNIVVSVSSIRADSWVDNRQCLLGLLKLADLDATQRELIPALFSLTVLENIKSLVRLALCQIALG